MEDWDDDYRKAENWRKVWSFFNQRWFNTFWDGYEDWLTYFFEFFPMTIGYGLCSSSFYPFLWFFHGARWAAQ